MEDLNKNQIVLLTLLVSFVTSIATGIITVSLLQEAPIEVTRNINSIVEKTIETVTKPGTISTQIQKEITTIVVKEEDSVIDSINKNVKSIVRINEKDGLTGITSFYGIGLVVTKDGYIATNRKTISNTNAYNATMSDGVEFQVTPTGVDKQTDFILFKVQIPKISESDQNLATAVAAKANYAFIPAVFGDEEPKLGQTIISLGGDTNNSIAVGRVTSLDTKNSTVGTTTTKYLSGINTDISIKDLVDGSPLLNLSGDVVGINLSPISLRVFTPISVIKKEVANLSEPPKSI